MDFHPASMLFPMLPEEELQELADDIREHGLHHPITLHEGQILDGRNRHAACFLAGVEPRFVEWGGNGSSPTAWVISENARRRHLTISQRAAVAVEALPLFEAEARERQRQAAAMTNAVRQMTHSVQTSPAPERNRPRRATEEAAALVGVSGPAVERAKRLKKFAPDLYEAVQAGKIAVNSALREAKERGSISTDPRKQKPKVKVVNGRVIREKPIPELEQAPPTVAAFIREFERGLSFDLNNRYPVLLHRQWEEVVTLLRQRLLSQLEGKAISTVAGAAKSGRRESA
jgi:hypothetical protein